MTKQFIGTKIITAWHDTKDGKDGYSVKYADGYTSWSPKDVFENAYRAIEGDSQALSFGDALVMLKQGKKLARAAWDTFSDTTFVYHVPAASYPAQTGVAKDHFGEGAMVPYFAYLAIKRHDNTVCVFAPSIDSLLADDWYVVK